MDDYSRYTWVYFLKYKGEILHKLIQFSKLVENENNTKIKRIRSNQGIEFDNHRFNKF